ncbi:hypothetical protein FXO37_24165 [Capsicum annuum]|nr:hypothetical protein FXO37_24165 [Capsicum annuum]
MDFVELKRRSSTSRRLLLLAGIAAICLLIFRNSSSFSTSVKFSQYELGVTHVLVTGGAGYIGSHATLRLLKDSYHVTIVDNLSRGNIGAVKVLQELFPKPGRLQFIYADLGDAAATMFLVYVPFLRLGCSVMTRADNGTGTFRSVPIVTFPIDLRYR